MRGYSRALFVLLLHIIVLSACSKTGDDNIHDVKYEIIKKYERGPVKATVSVSRKEIDISDTLDLALDVTAESGYEIMIPRFGDKLEQFGIIDYSAPAPRVSGDGKTTYRRRYTLEPFLSGEYRISPFKITFRKVSEGEDREHTIETEEIVIKVNSLLPDKHEELQIKDIAGIVEPPADYTGLYIFLSIAAAAVVICIVAVILIKKRRTSEKKTRVPPHVIAFKELEKLIAMKLIEKGEIKSFYFHISNILRRYIERRFGLRAQEMTTEEFLEELRWSGVLNDGYKRLLGDFLSACDLVKFAAFSPDNRDIQRTFDSCKKFINETSSRPGIENYEEQRAQSDTETGAAKK